MRGDLVKAGAKKRPGVVADQVLDNAEKAGASASGGRPKKVLPPGTRTQIGIRVGASVKQALDTAMRQTGRTQSQEAEFRLEMSFQTERLLDQALELAYGSEAAAILMILARLITKIGRVTMLMSSGGTFEAMAAMADWVSDPCAYSQAAKTIADILEALKPPGDPNVCRNGKPAPAEEHFAAMRQQQIEIVLAAIKNPDWGAQFSEKNKNPDLEQFAERTRKLAGPRLLSLIASDGGLS
jgi:hypothetical protein